MKIKRITVLLSCNTEYTKYYYKYLYLILQSQILEVCLIIGSDVIIRYCQQHQNTEKNESTKVLNPHGKPVGLFYTSTGHTLHDTSDTFPDYELTVISVVRKSLSATCNYNYYYQTKCHYSVALLQA